MRELRGDETLSSVAARLGIAKGELSMIERGHMIPRDAEARLLERVYGPWEEWYPAGVRRDLAPDIRACPTCGEQLDPGMLRSRVYHDECRPCRQGRGHAWSYPGHGPWPFEGQPCCCGEETWSSDGGVRRIADGILGLNARQLAFLRRLLADGGMDELGVREPRRPTPPTLEAGRALPLESE